MSETTPFLMHPEVKTEKDNIPEALKAEELSYEYLVTQEQMLSIFDEFKQYFCYEDLLNSEYIQNFEHNPDLQEYIDATFLANTNIAKETQDILSAINPELLQFYRSLKLNKEAQTPEEIRQKLADKFSEEEISQLYDQIDQFKGKPKALNDEELRIGLENEGFSPDEIDLHLLVTNIKKHHKELSPDRNQDNTPSSPKKHPIQFKDLVSLYLICQKSGSDQAFKNLISLPLCKNIYEHFKAEEKVDNTDRINARIAGTSMKLTKLMTAQWKLCIERLEELQNDPDTLQKIKTFGVSVRPEIKKQISDLKKKKTALKTAQLGKNVSVLESAQNIAELTGGDQAFIEQGMRCTQEALKQLGIDIEFGLGDEIEEQDNVINKEFLPAYINYKEELKFLYKMLNDGKIVETQYIKDIINKVMPYLTKNPPTVVYLNGDYGTGKTALAVHISRTKFGKEPIVVSGSKFLEPDRLTEEFQISKQEMSKMFNNLRVKTGKEAAYDENTPYDIMLSGVIGDKNELREGMIQNRTFDKYIKVNKFDPEKVDRNRVIASVEFQNFAIENNVSEHEMEDINTQINDLYSNSVQGMYVLRGIYLAMKEGRPLIIDEANAISQEVLIAFNDLMTKKHGETIQSNSVGGDFDVKEGYCVMWTGNTGRRYIERKDIDPATFSRIASILVEYLPQSVDAQNIGPLMDRLNLNKISEATFDSTGGNIEKFIKESRIQAESDQIFQILLIKMLNGRLGTEVLCKVDADGTVDRYSFIKDLYRISVASRMIMNLFEGKTEGVPDMPNLHKIIGSGEKIVLAEKLKKSNLSIRELIDNIVGGYTDEGCAMDLEYYVYNFVQKQALNNEEQAIVYALLQQAGLFNPADGWIDYQEIANETGLDSSEKLAKLKTELAKSPIDIVEKYKKLQVNGNYVSLLNVKKDNICNYTLEYLSSPEIMQLVFGYLPPRKKSEYDSYYDTKQRLETAEMTESEHDIEFKARTQRIVEAIKDNTSLLRADPIWQDYKQTPSSEKTDIIQAIAALGLHDKAIKDTMDEETFLSATDQFINIIVNFLESKRQLTPDQISQISNAETPEQKLDLLKTFHKEINQKNVTKE